MSIQLSENESRVAYTLAESVVQSLFAVPFEFFDDGDLLVFVDGVQKAEGADYTVAGGGGSTGSIFFPALTGGVGGTSVLIVRRIPVERVTDFLPGSDINRTALNEQLDILTAMIADVNDKVERSVRIGDADLGSTLLPEKDVRKGTVLGFDSTTGSVSSIPVDALSGFDSFYLGTFAIAPTTKLDGSPLVQGNLYFNSASSLLFVWDGAAWVDFSAPFGTMAAQDADNVSITGGSFSGITSLSGSVIASQGEAQAGTNPSKIPTVLRVAEQTTARLASQAEAQAGSDNTKLMTPLRTAEAIAALTPPVTALSQAQVQNAGDTTFGTVSGQRLAQAVAEFAPRWELLQDHTISTAVAAVSFTNLGGYRDIMVHLVQVETNNTNLRRALRVSSNNGASFISSGYGTSGSSGDDDLARLSDRGAGPRSSTYIVYGWNQTWPSKPAVGGYTGTLPAPSGIHFSGAMNALIVFAEGSFDPPRLTAGQILVFGRN